VAAVNDELEREIAQVCATAGLDLVDVELRQRTLQVTVEREGELDLDTIAEVARAISAFLDDHDELSPPAPFELEVSSPGLERRLRRPAHFERAVGVTVALRTVPGTEGERRVEGTLTRADAEGIVLDLPGGSRRISYDEIERAHTVFDWRAALAGGRKETDNEKAPKVAAGARRNRGDESSERESR
jgi:ribosome maturation factor RimP